MKGRMKLMFKTCFLFCATGLLILFLTYKVIASPTADDFVLRVEVLSSCGDLVEVAFPLSLVNSISDALPRDARKLLQDLNIDLKAIVQCFENMAGEDIVSVEGPDSVRIWCDPVTRDNRSELGFVTVHVAEGGRNGNDFTISLPRGLLQFTCKIVRVTGILDHCVQLPPEIKNLQFLKDIKFEL
ncbi:MAG: hypothetical protein AB1656_07600 [Candidatus Omnitrophota bacterium]